VPVTTPEAQFLGALGVRNEQFQNSAQMLPVIKGKQQRLDEAMRVLYTYCVRGFDVDAGT